MRHFFFFLLPLFLFPLLMNAAGPENDPVLLRAKLAILEADRSKSMTALTDTRMKHIRSDKNLKRMHDNIMTLHRNLALALDSKKDVREINDRLIRLDSEIRAVQKQLNEMKTNKPETK